ncbi:MAG: AsmA-like C-terminal region-containing protein [Acidobacteriota bacterium]
MATTVISKRRRTLWKWLGISFLVLVIALVVVGERVVHNAGPRLRTAILDTLGARFNSRVELGDLDVSILRGLEVSGNHLDIYPSASVVAAGAGQPLISIQHFSFHSGIIGLFFKPMHVGTVHITGLQINIPPHEMRQAASSESRPHGGRIAIVVDEIVCDQCRLIIGTSKPDKDPKDFDLKHIELHDVGPNDPWAFDATLTNAIPPGEIHSTGTFGPWQTESPGDSPVTGHYTFEHADLNSIKGIAGILSSVGEFKGQLNKIVVDGTTDTPDFSLDTGNHAMALHTEFHAIVDGTSGDTYLQPVQAKLRNSSFTASGAVINIKGHGHRIELDVDVPSAPLQDFLDLAIRTEPAVMTGQIRTKAKLQIPPGKESVTSKLMLGGNFAIRAIHFSNPKVQDKVDELSFRAQGKPEDAKPGAADVSSQLAGKFQMHEGVIDFGNLAYTLPGARVNLAGIYSLDGQRFDFHGKVLTDASLSEMVASPWKSLLLKTISPFFGKKGGGAEIPISIDGTKSEPKFGLDVFPHHGR